MKHIYAIFFLILVFRIDSPATIEYTVPKYNLQFSRLASTWDESIPLGNGMLGALDMIKGKLYCQVNRCCKTESLDAGNIFL